ncbi:hypothetical protein HXX25_12100 [Hyphobacterium sp. CCMP332]|uniref:hypothetical protein n=1 Tax=Hyphobacterium sp. CCMP332 TaxID=2749086 RepID=UPI00164FE23E|nr:hypothetical protein [Hyphobacterium sp. CCMP332]QNL20004.1 hypothetical protein HXX25_12100 [Hyphobacterium sp. CCMP332]
MFRILAGSAAVFALSTAAFALTPQEELTAACTESGNDAADCACAADHIVETLDETELAFMLAVMEADTNEPTEVMSIAAEQGMEVADIMVMGQKMQVAEPVMREACGIDEFN